MKFYMCFLLVAFGYVLLVAEVDGSPIWIRLYPKFLDYLANLFVRYIRKNLYGKNLGVYYDGKKNLFLITVKYKVYNVLLKRIDTPKVYWQLYPGETAVGLTSSPIDLTTSAELQVNFDSWSSSHSTISVKIKKLRFSTKTVLFRNKDQQVDVKVIDCNTHIDDVDLIFYGDNSEIYNLISSILERKFTSVFEKLACKITEERLKKLRESIIDYTLNLGLRFAPLNSVDPKLFYTNLLSDPVVKSAYIETRSTFSGLNISGCRTLHESMPNDSSFMVMVNLDSSLIHYIFESFGYNHGIIDSSYLEKKALFLGLRETLSWMHTSCYTLDCFSIFLPQISKKYPNSTLEVEYLLTEPPYCTVTDGRFLETGLVLNATVNIVPLDKNLHKTFNVLEIRVGINTNFVLEITGKKIDVKLLNAKAGLLAVQSKIGHIRKNSIKYNAILDMTLDNFIVPWFNKIFSYGDILLNYNSEYSLRITKSRIMTIESTSVIAFDIATDI